MCSCLFVYIWPAFSWLGYANKYFKIIKRWKLIPLVLNPRTFTSATNANFSRPNTTVQNSSAIKFLGNIILTQRSMEHKLAGLRFRIRGPGSGIRCLFHPGPGSGLRKRFFSGSRISDLGSRIPTSYFLELIDKFLGKKFFECWPKFYSSAFKKFNNFQFGKFVGTKKGLTTNIFSPLSFVAVFGSWIRDPRSRIRDPGPRMGKNQDPGLTSRIRNTAN